ncbi:MAG TPA: response regulator [Desulfuromonadales bacterium]
MTIQCPGCDSRYRIDPSRSTKSVARVKCPQCATVFEVNLHDAQVKSPAAAPVPAAPVPGKANSAAAAVLIVDDSKFFRELVADVLKPLQLQFLMAGDGNEALRIIRQKQPALVILDLNLPGMSGYELIRHVREEPSLRDLRLLAMSGVYRKETDVAEVQAAGADDFVSKSFKPEQLQARVKKLLAGQA